MSTGCQKDRKTGGQTSGQTDRQTDRKTDRLFSLVIKTKVFQNVNRMSKRQSDRKEDIQSAGQTDRVTERQNDSMADSRAAKEPALVFNALTNASEKFYKLGRPWKILYNFGTILICFRQKTKKYSPLQ